MAEPVALETAWRWIEANAERVDAEDVPLAAAHGRVPLEAPLAGADVPATACAIEAGYAVSAEATVGASPYNPLSCPVAEAGDSVLPRGTVARVGAGQPLRLRVQVRSFEAVCKLVQAGMGIGVLPEASAIDFAPQMGLRLIRLTDTWAERTMRVCVRDLENLPQIGRKLVEQLIGADGLRKARSPA